MPTSRELPYDQLISWCASERDQLIAFVKNIEAMKTGGLRGRSEETANDYRRTADHLTALMSKLAAESRLRRE